ncbi:MAG: DUF3108 domain-containing protein [Bacteroidetes bacterium]|nr:DUF3108 domain-containing protein [Bacteroidota bacterium]
MRCLFTFFAIMLCVCSNPKAQSLPLKTNAAFKEGETLSYRLHYGLIDAGIATIQVLPNVQSFGGHRVYHIVGDGYSRGAFNWFFKVKDRYETYIDADALVPWYFVRHCNEGGFIINQNYVFNHYEKKVDIGDGKNYSVPQDVQDMLSSFYYARNIDYSSAKTGDVFLIPSFVDKENWTLKIKYVGKETINTDVGKFRCLKFRPIIQTGRIFKKEEDLNVWITDDKNHIPIRAQAKILVGSIKMDLTSYNNLANPPALEK